jgi:hypothetical protein
MYYRRHNITVFIGEKIRMRFLKGTGYVNKERQVSSNKYERWVEANPHQLKGIQKAREMLLTDRYTLVDVCEELTKRGYSRSNGRPWAWTDPKSGKRKTAGNILHKIFHNPFYAGWVVSERFGIRFGEIRENGNVQLPQINSSVGKPFFSNMETTNRVSKNKLICFATFSGHR